MCDVELASGLGNGLVESGDLRLGRFLRGLLLGAAAEQARRKRKETYDSLLLHEWRAFMAGV